MTNKNKNKTIKENVSQKSSENNSVHSITELFSTMFNLHFSSSEPLKSGIIFAVMAITLFGYYIAKKPEINSHIVISLGILNAIYAIISITYIRRNVLKIFAYITIAFQIIAFVCLFLIRT